MNHQKEMHTKRLKLDGLSYGRKREKWGSYQRIRMKMKIINTLSCNLHAIQIQIKPISRDKVCSVE